MFLVYREPSAGTKAFCRSYFPCLLPTAAPETTFWSLPCKSSHLPPCYVNKHTKQLLQHQDFIALIAFLMSDPVEGREKTPKTAYLVFIPPVLIVIIAVVAIRLSEKWPRYKESFTSWYRRAPLFRGRKRASSDPPERHIDSEAPKTPERRTVQ